MESPTLTNDNGVNQCEIMRRNTNLIIKTTGHYEVLMNAQYRQIGCAFAARDSSKPLPVTIMPKKRKRQQEGGSRRGNPDLGAAGQGETKGTGNRGAGSVGGTTDKTAYFQGFWVCDLA